MTSADEIRTAAIKLRALATGAAEGSGNSTWKATRHHANQPNSGFTALNRRQAPPQRRRRCWPPPPRPT